MTCWGSITIEIFRAQTALHSARPKVTIAVFLGDEVAASNPVPMIREYVKCHLL